MNHCHAKHDQTIKETQEVRSLNSQRAKEIVSSPTMVNVTCDGVPFYIQHVDEKSETARIYPLGQPEKEQEVALSELNEI